MLRPGELTRTAGAASPRRLPSVILGSLVTIVTAGVVVLCAVQILDGIRLPSLRVVPLEHRLDLGGLPPIAVTLALALVLAAAAVWTDQARRGERDPRITYVLPAAAALVAGALITVMVVVQHPADPGPAVTAAALTIAAAGASVGASFGVTRLDTLTARSRRRTTPAAPHEDARR